MSASNVMHLGAVGANVLVGPSVGALVGDTEVLGASLGDGVAELAQFLSLMQTPSSITRIGYCTSKRCSHIRSKDSEIHEPSPSIN